MAVGVAITCQWDIKTCHLKNLRQDRNSVGGNWKEQCSSKAEEICPFYNNICYHILRRKPKTITSSVVHVRRQIIMVMSKLIENLSHPLDLIKTDIETELITTQQRCGSSLVMWLTKILLLHSSLPVFHTYYGSNKARFIANVMERSNFMRFCGSSCAVTFSRWASPKFLPKYPSHISS